MRLNRYLAACGLGSRRFCDTLIAGGKVSINGQPLTNMGVQVDPETDIIKVEGKVVKPQNYRYLALNKPRDVISTAKDEKGRKTALSLLPDMNTRLYNVGRLDRMSEGLLLFMNDGELAHRLTHPKHHIPKTYHVRLVQVFDPSHREALLKGIEDEGELLKVHKVQLRENPHHLTLTLKEGKNRHIRRMLTQLNYDIKKLKRTAIGPLKLGGLNPGQYRELSPNEVAQLKQAVSFH